MGKVRAENIVCRFIYLFFHALRLGIEVMLAFLGFLKIVIARLEDLDEREYLEDRLVIMGKMFWAGNTRERNICDY